MHSCSRPCEKCDDRFACWSCSSCCSCCCRFSSTARACCKSCCKLPRCCRPYNQPFLLIARTVCCSGQPGCASSCCCCTLSSAGTCCCTPSLLLQLVTLLLQLQPPGPHHSVLLFGVCDSHAMNTAEDLATKTGLLGPPCGPLEPLYHTWALAITQTALQIPCL